MTGLSDVVDIVVFVDDALAYTVYTFEGFFVKVGLYIYDAVFEFLNALLYVIGKSVFDIFECYAL